MTIMRTNVDGKDYLVLHYRFAINNPDATIRKSNDTYFADIGNITYVLGISKSDRDPNVISNKLESKIHKE